MRYIKKYNLFSINENMDKNSDNEFFRKVDISEFRKSKPALSKEESVIIFDKLKSIFSDVEFDELESISFRSLNVVKDTTDHISFNAEKIGVDILLYDDEWFGVSIVHFGKGKQEYYMCDQFEGLIKLLKLKLSDEEKVMESKLDSNDYYCEISSIEYGEYGSEEYDDNSWEMISKIRKILPNAEYTSINEEDNKISLRALHANFHIHINFIKDEWFILKYVPLQALRITPKFYKCDQLEGLIKLFKDLGLEVNERVVESKLDRPNYKKLDIDGFIVYQGKDAKSNDYVTFELSDDEDYWFHAHNFAGSHLLLKIKDKLPQNETIKKVAELAAKNSKAPNGDVVVVWSKKKFIKKERAMNPGQVKVDYINSNKITIRK